MTYEDDNGQFEESGWKEKGSHVGTGWILLVKDEEGGGERDSHQIKNDPVMCMYLCMDACKSVRSSSLCHAQAVLATVGLMLGAPIPLKPPTPPGGCIL